MLQQFNKAHIAALVTLLTGVATTFLPAVPVEVVTAAGTIAAWGLTFAIPNRG